MEETDYDSLEWSNVEENETSQSSESGDDYIPGTDSSEELETDQASEAHGRYNMDTLKDNLNEISSKCDSLRKLFDEISKDVNEIKGRDVTAFGVKLKEYHKTTAAENQVLNKRLDRMKEKHNNFVISTAELSITDNNILNLINKQNLLINSLQEKTIYQTLINEVQDCVDGLVGTADHFGQDIKQRLDKAATEIKNIFTDFLQNNVSDYLRIQCQTLGGKFLLLLYKFTRDDAH